MNQNIRAREITIWTTTAGDGGEPTQALNTLGLGTAGEGGDASQGLSGSGPSCLGGCGSKRGT